MLIVSAGTTFVERQREGKQLTGQLVLADFSGWARAGRLCRLGGVRRGGMATSGAGSVLPAKNMLRKLHIAILDVELFGLPFGSRPLKEGDPLEAEKEIMKKLMMFGAVAIMTANLIGCHHCRWRGSACAPAPAASACDPCGQTPAIGGAAPVYGGETYVTPGPGMVPGPVVQ